MIKLSNSGRVTSSKIANLFSAAVKPIGRRFVTHMAVLWVHPSMDHSCKMSTESKVQAFKLKF